MNLQKYDLFGNLSFARYFSEENGGDPAAGGGGGLSDGDSGGAGSPPPPELTQFFESDGTYKEGWKDLLPEEIRHEVCLDTVKSLPEAYKQFVNAQKVIGKNKVAVPDEHSSQTEIDIAYNAMGRPESPDGYTYEEPEDINIADMSRETMKPVFEKLHAAGASQKVLDVAMGEFKQYLLDLQGDIQSQLDQEYQEAENKILAETGDALEDLKHYANLLVAENSPNEEYKQNLLEAINDNNLRPYLFSFLATVQKKYFGSHGGVPANEGGGADGTPAGLRARAEELQQTSGYITGELKKTDLAKYNSLTKQIQTLYNQIEFLENKNKKP